MSEADRLVADLQDGLNDFNGYIPDTNDVLAHFMAERLIALGWTRLDEERLAHRWPWWCAWCGVPLTAHDGTWTDRSPTASGDYCPEGLAVDDTGTSPHLPTAKTYRTPATATAANVAEPPEREATHE